MLLSVLKILFKKIEILCRGIVKNDEFYFLKVKNCLFEYKTTTFNFLNKYHKDIG